MSRLLGLLRDQVGVDFEEYKPSTVRRRLSRRLALRKAASLADYLDILRADPNEARALFDDILIHVTSFFRDEEAFEALREKVFPRIIEHKKRGEPVRIWATGCSTGEEAYSLAISFMELMDGASVRLPLQVFGGDVSARAIETARAGCYSEEALRNVSEARRSRFFKRVDDRYRISPAVREACVFARHDLAKDPPFSRLDLVTCRNVLIYFHQPLQQRLLDGFHYSLNQPGFLLLGRSEGLARTGGFSVVDKANRIFARTGARRMGWASPIPSPTRSNAAPASTTPRQEVARRLDQLLAASYGPPGVLVNERMEVLQFRGRTGPYLESAAGEPQSNLLEMLKEGLLAEVRLAMAKAKGGSEPVRRQGLGVKQENGSSTRFDLVVAPLPETPATRERLFLILFEETSGKRKAASRTRGPAATEGSRLARELASTREYLSTLVHEQQGTNDELTSANEELVSSNEELQSLNEELETAKEELQSGNEELTTVNEELQVRNHELAEANGDLSNVLSGIDEPLLIVDGSRRIRRFTPRAGALLNLKAGDVGRPIAEIRSNLLSDDLDARVGEVLDRLTPLESETQDRQGVWYRLRVRPYRTVDNRLDGALITLADIDHLKRAVGKAETAREAAMAANDAKDQFLATLSHELRTPLNVLALQVQILRRGRLDAARLKRATDVIARATRAQTQLVADLLDVSRIVAGKLRIESKPVSLSRVVALALDSVRMEATRKSIALTSTRKAGAAKVQGDAVRLQQVVSNILANAVKFTPENGRVDIRLDRLDEQARIRVRDDGAGISPEFLPHLFERFTQADSSSTRSKGGLGLGLAIVHHLVRAHGGNVLAASEGPGRGSTFTVLLPLHPASAAGRKTGLRRKADTSHETRLTGIRVLLVDDDTDTREILMETLRLRGGTVRSAGSAQEAIDAFGSFRPDVLLCDIAMPDQDGYELLRQVRALGPARGGDVAAAALTAFAGESEREKAKAAGFRMHLTKPVEVESLVRAVATLARDG